MANLLCTRFDQIFPNRETAIAELDNTGRCFGELVVVRYYSVGQSCHCPSVEILIAMFLSAVRGDYKIIFDSTSPTQPACSSTRVFPMQMYSDKLTLDECIEIALYGEIPIEGDIVIITSPLGDIITSYIFKEDVWLQMNKSSGGSSEVLQVVNSETITLTLTTGSLGQKILKADVNIDGESLVVDPTTDKIVVNEINGGTY